MKKNLEEYLNEVIGLLYKCGLSSSLLAKTRTPLQIKNLWLFFYLVTGLIYSIQNRMNYKMILEEMCWN